ncbi:PsbP domain-containing protein 1 chloroplastic [Bienertia sinuspersici]
MASIIIFKSLPAPSLSSCCSCSSTNSRLQMGSLVFPHLPPQLKPSYKTICKAQIEGNGGASFRYIATQVITHDHALAEQSVNFREYIDFLTVKGAGADIFFRDPFVLDENLSVDISSPSSSNYKSVEDLGPPEEAGKNVMRQYLTEFMSTRLGVRRESNILSTSSKVADDGKLYYQIEVNIKSYANNNELAVMPEERLVRLEWIEGTLQFLEWKTIGYMSCDYKYLRMYSKKKKMSFVE